MADYFTSTCFRISITAAEASLLAEVQSVSAALCDNDEPKDLSAEFMRAFPSQHAHDPVAGFLDLFADADYPWVDGDFVTVGDPDNPDRVTLTYGSSEADPDLIAKIIQRACPSALPFRFGWAGTCTSQRPDAFGGGWLEVRADAIVPLTGPNDDPSAKLFVIATRSEEEGLIFWNNDTGFGDMALATVFTEAEANTYDLPIANDEPEWLELPPIPR